MKILLSPAKSLNETSTVEFDQFTLPIFLKEAEVLVKKLKKMKAEKLGKLMHNRIRQRRLFFLQFMRLVVRSIVDLRLPT